MTPSDHNVIGSQRFEIGMDRKRRPMDVQDAFSRAQRNVLEKVINEVLNEFAPADRWYRLDAVHLDIGTVSYDHLERDLAEGVRLHLRRALRSLMDQAEQGGDHMDDGRSLDQAVHLTELLRHYLLNGTYPWWGTRELPVPDTLFDTMAVNFAAQLVSMIRDIGRKSYVRKRLVLQFDDARLQRLVHLLEPAHAAFILTYAEQLRVKHEKKRVVPDDAPSFRNAKWEFILKYLLVDRGSLFNRRAFLKSLLQNLATSYRLSYLRFLEFMQAEFRAEDIPQALTSALPFLLRELLMEERLRLGEVEEGDDEVVPRDKAAEILAERHARWVMHYLRFGTLPPEAEGRALPDKEAMEELVRQWVLENETRFRKLFREAIAQTDPGLSPSRHFSHDLNWFLLKAYAKTDHAVVFSMAEVVERMLVERSGVERASSRSWMAQAKWPVIFGVFRARKSVLRSSAALFQSMMGGWATTLGVPSEQLAHRLFYASMSAGAEVLLHSPELIQLARTEGIVATSGTAASVQSAQQMIRVLRESWQSEEGPRDRRISRLLKTLEGLAMKEQTDVVSALVDILVQLQAKDNAGVDSDMVQALDVILKRLASSQSAKPLRSKTVRQLGADAHVAEGRTGKKKSKGTKALEEEETRLSAGSPERVMDTFIYLLRQGALPWWSPFESANEVERAFAWLIKTQSSKLRKALTKLLQNDRLLMRMANADSEKQLELLLIALDSSKTHVLRTAFTVVEFMLEQELEMLGKLPVDWRMRWRLFLIQAAVFKPKTVADQERFWVWAWQELEARLGTERHAIVWMMEHFATKAPIPVAAKRMVNDQLQRLRESTASDHRVEKPMDDDAFTALLTADPVLAALFGKTSTSRDIHALMHHASRDQVVWYYLHQFIAGKPSGALSLSELILLLMESARQHPAQVKQWLKDPQLRLFIVESLEEKHVLELRATVFPATAGASSWEKAQTLWLAFAKAQLTALQFEKLQQEFHSLLLLDAAYQPMPAGGMAVIMLRLMLRLLARHKRKPVEELLPALFRWHAGVRDGANAETKKLDGEPKLQSILATQALADLGISVEVLEKWLENALGITGAVRKARAIAEGRYDPEAEEKATVGPAASGTDKVEQDTATSDQQEQKKEGALDPLQKKESGKPSQETEDETVDPEDLTGMEEWGEEDEEEEEERLDAALDQMVFVDNAGVILLWPFLGIFFERAGLMRAGMFHSPKDAYRAVHLLHYAVWKTERPPEFELVLDKLLCGVKPGKPLLRNVKLSDADKQLCEELLTVVLQRWEVVKNTSPDGLRESFLQRSGKLYVDGGSRKLAVEKKAYDLLLDQLPWSINMVRLSWMEELLEVTWR